jgi:hypothetical protein
MSDEAATIELSRPYFRDVTYRDMPVPLMSGQRPDPRISEIARRCSAFLELPEDWNSYRARRTDRVLLQSSLEMLAMVLTPATKSPDVVPTATGGIQIEWHAPNQDLEVEIRALGVYRVYHRHGDSEDEFDVTDDLSDITRRIRMFSK